MLNKLLGRITVDEVEEESSIKCIERNRAEEILEDEGNTVGIDYFGLEMNFAHKKYTVTAVRGNITICFRRLTTNMHTV